MNAVLYARFSPRPNADECDSVAKQLERCRKWCEALGHVVLSEHFDENKSGATTDKRPGLADAISAATAGKCLLVVYSVDRLSRNTEDLLGLSRRLIQAKAGLASVTQSIDTSTPGGRAMLAMLGVFATMQREEIAERTSRAMRAMQAAGRRMSKECPAGWKPNGEPGKMEPCEDEREAIDHAIRLKAQGCGLRSICLQLEADGFLFRGRRWTHTTLMKAIRRQSCEGE